METIDLNPYFKQLDALDPMCRTGEVVELTGLLVVSRGPGAAVGDFCEIRTAAGRSIRTQVIGFRDGRVLSMPRGDRRAATRRHHSGPQP